MLYLTCTTITSLDLAHYEVSRVKDWVSVDCGTITISGYIGHQRKDLFLNILVIKETTSISSDMHYKITYSRQYLNSNHATQNIQKTNISMKTLYRWFQINPYSVTAWTNEPQL